MSGSPVTPQQNAGLNGLLSALSAPAPAAGGESSALFASIFSQHTPQSLSTTGAGGGDSLPPAAAAISSPVDALRQLAQSLQQFVSNTSEQDFPELPGAMRQQLTQWLAEFSGARPGQFAQLSDKGLLETFGRELQAGLEQLTVDEKGRAKTELPEALVRLLERSGVEDRSQQIASGEQPGSSEFADGQKLPEGRISSGADRADAPVTAQRALLDDAAPSSERDSLAAQLAALFAPASGRKPEQPEPATRSASATDEPDMAGLAPEPLQQAVQQAIAAQESERKRASDELPAQPVPQAGAMPPASAAASPEHLSQTQSAQLTAPDTESGSDESPARVSGLTQSSSDAPVQEADTLWAAQSGQGAAESGRQPANNNASALAQSQTVQADGRNSQMANPAMPALNGQAEAGAQQDADALGANRGEQSLFQNQLNNVQQQRAVNDQQQLQQSMQQGPRLATPAWQQHVGERLVMMVGQGKQTAQINLDPPELGTLQIRIQVDNSNGQVSVNFSSAHLVVRDAVEGSMVRLREMFAEQGLQLSDASVGDQSQQDSQRHSRNQNNGYAYAGGGTGGEQPLPENARALSLVDFYA